MPTVPKMPSSAPSFSGLHGFSSMVDLALRLLAKVDRLLLLLWLTLLLDHQQLESHASSSANTSTAVNQDMTSPRSLTEFLVDLLLSLLDAMASSHGLVSLSESLVLLYTY